MTFEKEQLVEILLIIHQSDLWEKLSPETKEIAQNFLQKVSEEGIRIKPNKPLQPNLSLSEYLNVLGEGIGLSNLQSDFWAVVIRIVFVMISIEKDPTVAAQIRQLKDDDKLIDYIKHMLGEY